MADPAPLTILWPDGRRSEAIGGEPWLEAARRAGQLIPTACRVGSCGACEIEINGVPVRACIAEVRACPGRMLEVRPSVDPFW